MNKRLSYFDAMQEKISASLQLLPVNWRKEAEIMRDKMAQEKGYCVANTWLDDLTEPLRGLLDIAADDDDLKAARMRSRAVLSTSSSGGATPLSRSASSTPWTVSWTTSPAHTGRLRSCFKM